MGFEPNRPTTQDVACSSIYTYTFIMDQGETPKPNWKEAFQGKDVVRGGELVNNLLYENVGIPVYSMNFQEKRTKFLVDREIGEEDFTVRQKEERDHKLLGLIIPSQDKNEFVYLGVEEGGFVFSVDERRSVEFHKDTTTSFSLSWERFGDYVANNVLQSAKTILREESDPSRFMEIVVNAVQKERERTQQIKEKRTSVREDLIKKLFGRQE